jgi:hypothetical protein
MRENARKKVTLNIDMLFVYTQEHIFRGKR